MLLCEVLLIVPSSVLRIVDTAKWFGTVGILSIIVRSRAVVVVRTDQNMCLGVFVIKMLGYVSKKYHCRGWYGLWGVV